MDNVVEVNLRFRSTPNVRFFAGHAFNESCTDKFTEATQPSESGSFETVLLSRW